MYITIITNIYIFILYQHIISCICCWVFSHVPRFFVKSKEPIGTASTVEPKLQLVAIRHGEPRHRGPRGPAKRGGKRSGQARSRWDLWKFGWSLDVWVPDFGDFGRKHARIFAQIRGEESWHVIIEGCKYGLFWPVMGYKSIDNVKSRLKYFLLCG